jgi:hypothetical protein
LSWETCRVRWGWGFMLLKHVNFIFNSVFPICSFCNLTAIFAVETIGVIPK